jgi:hypothetical protein
MVLANFGPSAAEYLIFHSLSGSYSFLANFLFEHVHGAHFHALLTSIAPFRINMHQIEFKCPIFLAHNIQA